MHTMWFNGDKEFRSISNQKCINVRQFHIWRIFASEIVEYEKNYFFSKFILAVDRGTRTKIGQNEN